MPPKIDWAWIDGEIAGFLAACVDVLDRDPTVVLASPATMLIDEAGLPLPYSVKLGGMVDRSGACWPMMPEKNDGLMASDPAVRFEAVMLNMRMCVVSASRYSCYALPKRRRPSGVRRQAWTDHSRRTESDEGQKADMLKVVLNFAGG